MESEEYVRLQSDKDYRNEIYKLVYNTITSKSANLNVDVVGDYLKVLKIRDAVIHTLYTNTEDRELFLDWFDSNKDTLSRLNEEHKAHYLSLMVGVLFLEGRFEIAYNTGKLGRAYADSSGTSANLINLILGAMDEMGNEVAHSLFQKSLKALTLEDTLA